LEYWQAFAAASSEQNGKGVENMKITNEMIHTAYEISKCAYNGIYTFSEAKEEIHRTTGMNPNSAADYIHNFRYMIEGERTSD